VLIPLQDLYNLNFSAYMADHREQS
jgi:hypothetical protein